MGWSGKERLRYRGIQKRPVAGWEGGRGLRTREVGREAEGIVAFLRVMAVAVVAHASGGTSANPSAPGPAQAAAGLPGLAHRVLNRAIAQPARVAPV